MPEEIEVNVNDVSADFFEWFYKLRLVKRPSGNNGGKTKKAYIDIISAFDIETTRILSTTKADRDKMIEAGEEVPADHSVMYIWQWCFMDKDYNYICVYGREWPEFITFYRALTRYMDDKTFLVVYVHNLSYEFQFLRGIMPFKEDDVFCIDSRQPLKACSGNIEFRCSYKLSNMSLRKFAEQEQCKHLKTELEYTNKRYWYTPLTDDELRYCLNDVICLCEAIINKMKGDKDTLYTIPLTSTGYVRREIKREVHKYPETLQEIRDMFPDMHIYQRLKEAFRGGNTHANRYYTGKLIDSDIYGPVHSADRSSSYPAVICNNLFPMSHFEKITDTSVKNIEYYITDLGRALLMRVAVWDLTLSDVTWGCPYISLSKCRKIENYISDNGRVLSADYFEITLTDVDYQIIQNEYKGRFMILEAYSAKYGKLPVCITRKVVEYYKNKTALKGIPEQSYFYAKSKNLINACYGMMVQDPCKDLILFKNGDTRHLRSDYESEGRELSELLEESHKKAFLNYAWGIWVTAWARYELEEGIRCVHESKSGAEFLYCDTDSVKYIGDADFSVYNKNKISDCENSGAYASDRKGAVHYMGVFEQEEDMNSFVTLGAKKYAFEDEERKLHITVAGVGKIAGAEELTAAARDGGKRGIELFKEGFIFDKAGGLEAVYNDIPYGDYVTLMDSNNREEVITSNVCLRETTYTLGLTSEYRDLIRGLQRSAVDDVL